MTEVYIMRHGESEAQFHTDQVGGRQDHIELSTLGREQPVQARAYMDRYGIHPTKVYSSTARRAIDTAQIAMGVEPIIDARFCELTHGEHEGKPRIEVYTPEVIELIGRYGMDFALSGGESTNMVADRVLDGVLEIAGQASERDVIYIASHGIAIKALIARLRGFDQGWIYRTPSPNVCLTRLVYSDGRVGVDPEFQLVDTLA